MLTRPWLPLSVFLLLAAGLAWVACGGGGDGAGEPLSLSEIPTATPPDELPDVRIVSGTPAGPSGGQRYTVQAGDNPSLIADQFGVSLDELMEANGIVDPTSLYVGQELIIPGAEPERQVLGATATPRPRATTRPTATAEPQTDGNTYIVREGDIPETIAAQFGITAEELMAANGITDPTSLDIGQELVIPAPRPTPSR